MTEKQNSGESHKNIFKSDLFSDTYQRREGLGQDKFRGRRRYLIEYCKAWTEYSGLDIAGLWHSRSKRLWATGSEHRRMGQFLPQRKHPHNLSLP
ncbi:MAG: hypothetical protein LBG73_00005 [Spirochaetaceae bacterium]|nr:hypothetical protein [Spirochaetaceae bacterium]